MVETFYRFANNIVETYSDIVDLLTTEVFADYSVIEIMFGLGIGAFIGFTLAKWAIDVLP